MDNQKKIITFAVEIKGAMLEWLKRHAWKACIRQKRIPSSNLGRSANNALRINQLKIDFQCFLCVYMF